MESDAGAKHWSTARDLVGDQAPTQDDVPTTRSGQPLDTPEKLLEFLTELERAAAK